MEEGQEIQSTMVSRMIERVQRKMEAHNFDIRKNLLEYDAVNNEQRKRAFELLDSPADGVDEVEPLLQVVVDEVCSNFGIGLRVKHVALSQHVVLDGLEVLDDAIVNDGHPIA